MAQVGSDELDLLIELASAQKIFNQVRKDAARLGLWSLVASNTARGITQRLHELTGISKDSLCRFPIRCKPEAATAANDRMNRVLFPQWRQIFSFFMFFSILHRETMLIGIPRRQT